MRRVGFLISFLSVIPFFISGCARKSSPNTLTATLALSAIGKAANEPSTVASAQAAASAASQAISSAANSGSVSYNINSGKPEKLLALAHRKAIHKILSSSVPGVIPTNLTGASSCSSGSGSCTGTLSGTTSCPLGGSVTLTGVNVTLTYTSTTTGQFSFSSSMSGPFSFSQCAVQAWDFGSFPNVIMPVISGDMTYNGSINENISNMTSTATTMSANFTYKESDTINSNGLIINGGNSTSISNLVSAVNLQVSEVQSNAQGGMSGSLYTFSADVQDTLTGTYSVSGTVGGNSINFNKTYSNSVYYYHVSCFFDSSSGSSSCTIN